jgi:hypothetical protein
MGNLPSKRVQPARPFINCGVDYAGPIVIKQSKGRGKNSVKTYVALFICLATKAIHLQLVTDCSTETFLGALKRFIARRGMVSSIYSDNGTNIVGANRELNKLFISQEFKSDVINQLLKDKIAWHFIPPRSPHFGGVWEAGVKSFKYHFKRVVGENCLSYEEMSSGFENIIQKIYEYT